VHSRNNAVAVTTSLPDRFGVFQVFGQNGVFISANRIFTAVSKKAHASAKKHV